MDDFPWTVGEYDALPWGIADALLLPDRRAASNAERRAHGLPLLSDVELHAEVVAGHEAARDLRRRAAGSDADALARLTAEAARHAAEHAVNA